MKHYLHTINSLLEEIGSLPPISDENERKLDKKFRLEFNFNSNHIEGNTLTYSETELLLIFDKTSVGHEMREFEEMKAHDVAYKLMLEWASDQDFILTEKQIKELNQIILVRPFWKEATTTDGQSTRRLIEPGQYKKYPNSVRLQNGEIFEYASPLETPMKMGDLMQWYNEALQNNELHPIELAALFHYKFVLIHPFDDGNGRISRLLMNYILLKNTMPPVVIKSESKSEYLNALNQADIGNMEAFVDFIAQQLIWSLQIKKRAIKGEDLDELGDLEKKLALFKNNIGIESEIQIYYSETAVVDCINNSIFPLLKAWENKCKKFDSLFYNRQCVIQIDDDNGKGNSIVLLFQSLIKTLYNFSIKEINIISSFTKLRTKGTDTNFNGGNIKINFLSNVYEIEFTGSKDKINKLYHEVLSPNEITIIVSSIGNWLFNNIESNVENS